MENKVIKGFDTLLHNDIVIKSDNCTIGSHCAIDKGFYCTTGLFLGDYIHISPYVTCIGGKETNFTAKGFNNVMAGARIICGSDRFDDSGLFGAMIPNEYKGRQIMGNVTMERFSNIGTNAVVFPGSILREGVLLCAGSVLMGDTEEWGVYKGNPAVLVKKIDGTNIKKLASDLEKSKLIFDIGFNNGSDTEYYLHKGFKVVGVDANPLLINNAKIKFENEIKTGRLILLNYGISDKYELLDFFVNTKVDAHSSFLEALGRRNDPNSYIVNVECTTVSDIIKMYGKPYYLKIDIEGYDNIALQSLIGNKECVPEYISIEAYDEPCIDTLVNLGYKQFKFINQRLISIQNDDDWQFDCADSSGKFAELTPGEWIDENTLRDLFRKKTDEDWFDIHAKF